jgi:hypothetical protein
MYSIWSNFKESTIKYASYYWNKKPTYNKWNFIGKVYTNEMKSKFPIHDQLIFIYPGQQYNYENNNENYSILIITLSKDNIILDMNLKYYPVITIS